MNNTINLLWTSGADSTFRLMQLLLIQKKKVQPYYIIDRTRKSLQYEIGTMEKIKEMVFERDPSTKELLFPTIFKELREIKLNPTITEQYKRLATIDHLGIQYEWLPRFAEEMQLYDLELSLTSGEHSDSYFRRFLRPNLIKETEGEFFNYRMGDKLDNPDLSIFKYFYFPIIEWSKLEMKALAKKYNFYDIMKETWFCHAPIDNMPCGVCNPCKIAIKEGMWKRIPVTGLLRNFAIYKVRPLIKGNPQPTKREVVVPNY